MPNFLVSFSRNRIVRSAFLGATLGLWVTGPALGLVKK